MNIREICEKYKISQSGLARRFGIPLRTVQNWSTGQRKAPEYVVRMIDELLQADDEVKAELRAQYLEQHPGADENEITGFVIARFAGLQREARQRMIRDKEADK